MRVILGVRQVRTGRKLAAVVTLAMFGTAVLGSGTVSGVNSPMLYVGTGLVDSNGVIVDAVTNSTGQPPADGIPDNAGVLIPTPVNAGYSTAIPVQVLNGDNQTIAHVLLAFALPAGMSIEYLSPPNAGTCDTVGTPATGVSCNFDNLPAGAVRSFFIVVATTVASEGPDIFTVQVTTNNANGSNLQIFQATSGAFQVLTANDNGLSNFVAPGQAAKTFNTAGVGDSNKLQTKLDFNQSAGGNLVQIAETEGTGFLYVCPFGLTCQPVETTVTIQDGLTGSSTTFASPFLAVTLTALVPKTFTLSKAFVAHYDADPTTPDWILYWADKSTRCGAEVAATVALIHQCFNTATLGKASGGFQTLVLTVTMESNGGIRM